MPSHFTPGEQRSPQPLAWGLFGRTLAGVVVTALLAFSGGCGSGGDSAKADPAALEAAFDATSADATIEEQPAEEEESTTDAIVIPRDAEGNVPVKEVAARAATAIRNDEVSEALMLLHTLRRAPNLSADQLTAVQQQMSALQTDLARRAENGDQRAKAALEMIQKSTRF